MFSLIHFHIKYCFKNFNFHICLFLYVSISKFESRWSNQETVNCFHLLKLAPSKSFYICPWKLSHFISRWFVEPILYHLKRHSGEKSFYIWEWVWWFVEPGSIFAHFISFENTQWRKVNLYHLKRHSGEKSFYIWEWVRWFVEPSSIFAQSGSKSY